MRTRLPHLSQTQAHVLALWCVGMVMVRSCALSAVAHFLAAALEGRPNSLRQQLRECCYEAYARLGRDAWGGLARGTWSDAEDVNSRPLQTTCFRER